MHRPILVAVAALFALAAPAPANGLDSGATCDDYEDAPAQTVVKGGVPLPHPSPAPGA